MHSYTEENYLKAIFQLSEGKKKKVSTNGIATLLSTHASSVTDMIQRLSLKNLVDYRRYQGVSLTELGTAIAVNVVRKHRLWEVFLVDHLNFKWDEVHEIAEELEHVKSPQLVDHLDDYLGNPGYDPHGDPIPDKNGKIQVRNEALLCDIEVGEKGFVVGVKEDSKGFLKHLESIGLTLGKEVTVLRRFGYDKSISILLESKKELMLSSMINKNILVKKGK